MTELASRITVATSKGRNSRTFVTRIDDHAFAMLRLCLGDKSRTMQRKQLAIVHRYYVRRATSSAGAEALDADQLRQTAAQIWMLRSVVRDRGRRIVAVER